MSCSCKYFFFCGGSVCSGAEYSSRWMYRNGIGYLFMNMKVLRFSTKISLGHNRSAFHLNQSLHNFPSFLGDLKTMSLVIIEG